MTETLFYLVKDAEIESVLRPGQAQRRPRCAKRFRDYIHTCVEAIHTEAISGRLSKFFGAQSAFTTEPAGDGGFMNDKIQLSETIGRSRHAALRHRPAHRLRGETIEIGGPGQPGIKAPADQAALRARLVAQGQDCARCSSSATARSTTPGAVHACKEPDCPDLPASFGTNAGESKAGRSRLIVRDAYLTGEWAAKRLIVASCSSDA